MVAVQRFHGFVVEDADLMDRGDDGRQFTEMRVCPKNCVNGYVRISRLEPVCQIVWQIDLPLIGIVNSSAVPKYPKCI